MAQRVAIASEGGSPLISTLFFLSPFLNLRHCWPWDLSWQAGLIKWRWTGTWSSSQSTRLMDRCWQTRGILAEKATDWKVTRDEETKRIIRKLNVEQLMLNEKWLFVVVTIKGFPSRLPHRFSRRWRWRQGDWTMDVCV